MGEHVDDEEFARRLQEQIMAEEMGVGEAPVHDFPNAQHGGGHYVPQPHHPTMPSPHHDPYSYGNNHPSYGGGNRYAADPGPDRSSSQYAHSYGQPRDGHVLQPSHQSHQSSVPPSSHDPYPPSNHPSHSGGNYHNIPHGYGHQDEQYLQQTQQHSLPPPVHDPYPPSHGHPSYGANNAHTVDSGHGQSTIEDDLALARRMQAEMLGELHHSNPSSSPYDQFSQPVDDRAQQELEDAKLAELLARGGSIRDLNSQDTHDVPPTVPIPAQREPIHAARPVTSNAPPRFSDPGPALPPGRPQSGSTMPPAPRSGGDLPTAYRPPPNNPPLRVPARRSLPTNPPPANPSTFPDDRDRPITGTRMPPPRPGPPIGGNDPVHIDQGPLQPKRQPRPVIPRGGGEPSIANSVPPGMKEPPMFPGAAALDVPAPKGKKTKKILGGLFGRNGGKDSESQSKSAPGGKGFLGRGRGSKPSMEGQTNNIDTTGSPPAAPKEGDTEGSVVKYKIPEPESRPADTIGAPKGPLPFSLTISKDAPALPEATVGRRAMTAFVRASATCSVCRQPAPNPLTALDKKFHSECFKCVTCHQVIDPTGPFAFVDNNGDKQPMHRNCYAEIFGINCCVCKQAIPAGPDGKVSFVKHPFFDSEQMCPRHARNNTRRCTGCHRFEPENEPFAELNDVERCVCMSCCRSVVVDSQDAQPLWQQVVEFFDKKLNLPIWKDFREVPILVVGYSALNSQMKKASNVHQKASQIMTRGLCLTEHESGSRIRNLRKRFDRQAGGFVACDAEDRGFTFFQVPDASKSNPDASVTAILCLSGLPTDLSASVLAHEATHAWIKLHPKFDFERPIPPQVEEGCAQLIALLFLSEGLGPPRPLENLDGSGPSDEKLRQYFKFNIETDDSETYGTGYRRAAMAYSKIGIEALMSHVVLYQQFPEI